MAAPRATLCALLALTCARAELYRGADESPKVFYSRRSIETTDSPESRGCLYAGRWFAAGAVVRAHDACLRCRCAHGALSCARAACAPAPAPPPRRCALLHRRDACCPELHCPDGVRSLELEATGRLEEEAWDVATPAARGHACAEEGAVFAAGSALAARAACEHCFCLRGVRRCVRPRCLPPPPGCAPRPAPGACCPSRYYCEKTQINITSTTPAPPMLSTTTAHRLHDCEVNGEWVPEGEQVPASGVPGNCSQCFCLRGAVRCQPLACAPALRGCTPLLRDGHCCPHQYHCPHQHSTDYLGPLAPILSAISDNSLISKRNDERSFRTSASTKSTMIARTAAASSGPTTYSASASPPATTKVKRKTSDPPPSTTSHVTAKQATSPKATSAKHASPKTTSPQTTSSQATSPSTTVNLTQEPITTTTAKLVLSTETTTAARLVEQTTEQPEGSVRTIINGTINCTAELSSTLTNMTVNETDKIEKEAQPRISDKSNVEAQTTTLEPTEIITDRNYGAGFAEGDTFVINVTSSLNGKGNSSRPFAPPAPPPVLTDITHTSNMSKKPKEDYDYDYTEPTLPPSLPNLKIIPFVAADAVVDDDVPAKEEPYTLIDREDKFPVYYPTIEQKEISYATRREDVYNPTQYPVFVSETNSGQLPKLPPVVETKKPVTVAPTTSTTREQTIPTPEVNLFSPPAETEGGFIPKGPGIIDEYFAVYPSTPPPVPHLTTSMQINPDSPDKVECVTHDGRRVPEGESVWLACSVCACAWAELHCAPRRCPAPPPSCRRRPASASSADLCCGEIVCDKENKTTHAPSLSTRKTEITLNVSKVPIEIESQLMLFDPPPDRSVPETDKPTERNQDDEHQENDNDVTNVTTSIMPPQIVLNTSTSMPIDVTKENPTTAVPELSSSTKMLSTPSSTSTPTDHKEIKNDTQSQEYEDEDDDEGFSFGSVLKLLLSDNYDSTTTSVKKKPTTVAITSPFPVTTSPRPSPPTTRRLVSKPTVTPFIPVQQHAYIPPKKTSQQNSVNRIDHLVLGEATAIKKTTIRPATITFRPISTPIRRFSTQTTTRKPIVTTRITTKVTKAEETTEFTPPPSIETARPAGVSGGGGGGGGGAGLLKLAGCNIYGRMYRVGRIIAELSTPCQECRCTELGVQCLPLRC